MTNSVIEGISARVISVHVQRQIMATFASCLLSLTGGVTFGMTAVLLPQLKTDADFPYDVQYDSWIASISPLAMIFGCLLSGPMSDWLGRKKGQLILILPFTIGWIIMGVANNNAIMIVGRFVIGICTGSVRALGMVYIGELSDPKLRAITLVCPSFAVYLGSLMSHTVGHYMYWRYACFFFGVPNLICFVILLFLKESPLWLITKRKTEEGVEAFKWFRGEGDASLKELASVLEKQEEKTTTSSFKEALSTIRSRPFLKSMATIFLLFFAVQMCGINTITFYAQDIFKNTFSGRVDAFLLMLFTDVIRVITTGAICLFAKKVPKRASFLASCYGTTVTLFGLIIYLYIQPEGLLWVALLCLSSYIAVASVLTSISWSFVAELFPSNVRGLGSGMSSLIIFCLLFISVKITPDIIAKFGEISLYISYAAATLVAGVLLHFILPETNGKSLQDIENSLYHKNSPSTQQITVL